MDRPIVELSGVCFAYDGIVALRNIELSVFEGETVVLEGCNGCGKSTLIRLLNGLCYPEQGTYKFEGEEITASYLKDSKKARAFHQKLGYVFQNADTQLFCSSVRAEVEFGPLQMGLSEEEARKRADDMLRLLGIEHLKDRAPYHLSGGEKRKVALGCILVMNPKVLVLDEPLTGLDKKTQLWLVDFLKTLKETGRTMIIATHNEELTEALADRRIMMNDDHEIEDIIDCVKR